MKTTLVTLFFAALVTLGFIAVIQSSRVAHRQKELALARSEQQQAERAAEELHIANQTLQQEREQLRHQIQSTTPQSATSLPHPAAPTRAAAEAATARAAREATSSTEPKQAGEDATGMGNLIAKMMEDPDTRKFIRDQQRQMMDPLYAPLIKQLGLNPTQAEQFKDFLADTQMKGAEKATSLFGGSTNQAEMLGKLATEQKSADEQIKAFLGDEGHAMYKDYQLTLGERMQLNQFKLQNAGSDSALTDPQTEILLAVMKEEKQNVAAMAGQPPSGSSQEVANMQAMLSGEQAEKLLQSQELVNQRVFERAKSVLPENQLNYLGRFQTNQLQTLRVGLNMAKKMFAPASPQGGAAQLRP